MHTISFCQLKKKPSGGLQKKYSMSPRIKARPYRMSPNLLRPGETVAKADW